MHKLLMCFWWCKIFVWWCAVLYVFALLLCDFFFAHTDHDLYIWSQCILRYIWLQRQVNDRRTGVGDGSNVIPSYILYMEFWRVGWNFGIIYITFRVFPYYWKGWMLMWNRLLSSTSLLEYKWCCWVDWKSILEGCLPVELTGNEVHDRMSCY